MLQRGTLRRVERIIGQIGATRPGAKIILRGDSGFCRNELMGWCEGHGVDYVFGLTRNQRLRKIIGQQMWQATEQWNRMGKPGATVRRVRLSDSERQRTAAEIGSNA